MRALALAARSRDPGLLKQFLATGWDAANCDAKNGYREIWYGSRCLLVAAELGLIGAKEGTVQKAFRNMKDLIASRRGRVLIHDVVELAKLAEMDPPDELLDDSVVVGRVPGGPQRRP